MLPESESMDVRRVTARAPTPVIKETPATGGDHADGTEQGGGALPPPEADEYRPRVPDHRSQTRGRPSAATSAECLAQPAAAAPFPMSRASVTAAGPRPAVRRTLAIPMLWLPCSRTSIRGSPRPRYVPTPTESTDHIREWQVGARRTVRTHAKRSLHECAGKLALRDPRYPCAAPIRRGRDEVAPRAPRGESTGSPGSATRSLTVGE